MSDTGSQNSREHIRRHPDHSIDSKKLAEMNAHDRVIAAYKIAASRNAGRPATATFRSQTIRDANILGSVPDYLKTPQLKRKEALIAEKEQRARERCKLESHSLKEYVELARGELSQTARCIAPSPWARDKTPRGEYMYNWRTLPEAHRSVRQQETPGPGAYTSDLFFIGL